MSDPILNLSNRLSSKHLLTRVIIYETIFAISIASLIYRFFIFNKSENVSLLKFLLSSHANIIFSSVSLVSLLCSFYYVIQYAMQKNKEVN